MGIQINGQTDTISAVDGSITVATDLTVPGALTYEDVTNIDSVGIITARNGIDVTGGTVTITTGANSASPAASGDNLVIKDSNGCGLSILSGNGNSQNIYLGSVSDNDAVRLEGFYNSGSPYFNIYTAGAERLRIDSAGRLLCGTSSGSGEPIAAFQGRSNDANDSGIVAITRTGTNPSGSIGELRFATGSDFNKYYAMVICQSDGSTTSTSLPGVLRFSTTASGSTSPTERMRITSDGKVRLPDGGKFTAGAGDDLQIYHNGTDSYVRDTATGSLILTGSRVIVKNAADNARMIDAVEGGAVKLLHNNVEKLETTLSGVAIHEDTDKVVRFTGGIGEIGNVTGFQGSNTAGNALTDLGMRGTTLRFATGSAERLRIDSGGRILIGTTSLIDGSTASNFQIASPSGPRLCIARNNTNVTGGNLMGALDFYGNDSDGNYEICGRMILEADGTHTTDAKPTRMAFYTTPSGSDTATERLRITSSGEVLISNSVNNFLSLDRTNASSGSGEFNLNVEINSQATISYDDGAPLVIGTSSSPRSQAGFSEKVRITSEGRLHLGNGGHGTTKVGGQEISGQDYSALLKLYDTRANIWGMQMRRDTGTGPNGIFVRAGNTSSNYSLYVCGTNESNTHLVCRGDGNVGVNTKDPAEHLHIVGAVRRDHSTSNIKFYEFSFELPTGGTTKIATVTGPVVSSMAIAKFEYVGLYDYSGTGFYSGVEMASLRRSSSNSAYTYLQNSEIHAGGNNSSYQPNMFWQNGSNNTSDLMITTGSYVLIMGTIRITTYNLGFSRVISI